VSNQYGDLLGATVWRALPLVDFVPGDLTRCTGVAGKKMEVEVRDATTDDRRVHPFSTTGFG
jgi:hypothetical protein